MSSYTVYRDDGLLRKIESDPSYNEEKELTIRAGRGRFRGKVSFVANFSWEIIKWKLDRRLAMKMPTMYMTAKDYFEQSGITNELLEIAMEMFGVLGKRNPKPVSLAFQRAVRYICVGWHSRTCRAYKFLVSMFKKGKIVVSEGCGGSWVEIIALIASGNKDARLILVDKSQKNIDLTEEVIALFMRRGYVGLRDQVRTEVHRIEDHVLPAGTNVVISTGLLNNYFSPSKASAIMEKWFAAGVEKVLTDILYDPDNVSYEAKRRMLAVERAVGWKVGGKKGLQYCSEEAFCDSLPGRQIEFYDHGLNATVVVS